jgi:hypothetical protein
MELDYVAPLGALLLLVGMLGFFEIGFRIGRRSRARNPDDTGGSGSTVEAAVLGLLGLTLAFTFSGASDRLTVRRAQIVQEANAIGTAYLRVDTLPPEDQPQIRALFRQYLESRIETYEQFSDRAASDQARARGGALQMDIWHRSVASCQRASGTGACLLVLPPLNDMFDITTTRVMAARMHLPAVILGLLVLLCFLGALLSGYSLSAQPRHSPLRMIVFSLAISATLYVLLDLEFPRVGLINLKSMDEAIIGLRETLR